MARKITIRELLDSRSEYELGLVSLTGDTGLDREIMIADINRPGLCLAGFFEHFAFDRIPVERGDYH